MQAVILAAGMGQRIREIHALPKGFLQIGGSSIISQSITSLRECGIFEILIITGFGAQYYTSFVAEDESIKTCFNPNFSKYGSLYSLYQAKDWVKDDVIVLESDIIYEKSGLKLLLEHKAKNAILVSGFTNSSDEVYVATEDLTLSNMSKSRESLPQNKILGEFVGITKLSFASFKHLMQRLKENLILLNEGHYEEHGLVFLNASHPIECVYLPHLLWAEIDNKAHLLRAQKIYNEMDNR